MEEWLDECPVCGEKLDRDDMRCPRCGACVRCCL